MRFAHLSGSPALDVLNTVDWRLDPERSTEQLVDMDSVIAWCRESEFVDADESAQLCDVALRHPRKAATALNGFQSARDDAYAALLEEDPTAIDAFADRQRQAFGAAGLQPNERGWAWIDTQFTLETPGNRLVRALAELMRSEAIAKLSRCADDACGWVYLDTSPRRNRRWCAASDCGDRNRARAYYRRQKDSGR